MKNSLLVPIAALALLFVAACSDSPSDPGTTPTTTSESYWPLSKGSTWTYDGPIDYTVNVVGDTTVAGKSWAMMTQSTDPGKIVLMRVEAGSYYWAEPNNVAAERITFKENLPVGGAWNIDFNAPNGTPNRAEHTVAATGLTRVVAGNSYSNVIQLHSKNYMQHPFSGDWMMFAEGDYYYAKGVGLIESDLGAMGVTTLTSYSIK